MPNHGRPRQRLSYVLPLRQSEPEVLSLPAPGVSRNFDPRPLLYSATTGQRIDPLAAQAPVDVPTTPQHCLGVSKLALDLTTAVLPSGQSASSSEHPNPQGLLYSAGRDGLIISSELNLRTKRRKRRIGHGSELKRARAERWEELGAFYSPSDSEAEDQDTSSEEEEPASRPNARFTYPTGRQASPSRRGPSRKKKHYIPFEEKWEIHEEDEDRPRPASKFRQSVQPHTDWINDLVLCNLNRTVITASSDQTIRAWDPHDPSKSTQPTLLGTHDDFVKSLAYCRDGTWVASGGLDHKIKLWDIQESRQEPLVELGEPSATSSIYSLATSPAGSLIASGSPERIIRLWDPRSNNPKAGQLVGHADNVRAILISDDGRHMLTASADATIKLWPISMQRCLHTFSFHSDSVWSLFSSHPNLDRFYSGDRSGLVCKTDMEGCGDIADAECVVICKDDDMSQSSSVGINSIVAADDTYVWTSSASSSIQRWRDVQPRSQRAASKPSPRTSSASRPLNVESLPLLSRTSTNASEGVTGAAESDQHDRRAVSFAPGLGISKAEEEEVSASLHSPSASPARPTFTSRYTSEKRSRPVQITDKPIIPELNGLPLESLVCLDPDAGYIPRPPGSVSALGFPLMHRTSSVLSNSLRQQAHYRQTTPHTTSQGGESPIAESPVQQLSRNAMHQYEDRELACDAVPLRLSPDETIPGRTGLVRCEMLNDRRTVLTLDTAGEIAVWDVVLGKCLGAMDRTELITTARKRRASQTSQSTSSSVDDFLAQEQLGSRRGSVMKELMELVKVRVEGEGVTNSWATVDVRVGALSVHLDESRCFAGETYLDESSFEAVQGDDYSRINLGKIVLRNLFDGFVQTEMTKSGSAPAPTNRLHRTSAPSHINLNRSVGFSSDLTTPRLGPPTIATALATPAPSLVLPPLAEDMPPSSKDLSAIPQSPAAANLRGTPGPNAALEGDYFSLANDSPRQSTAITPAASSGFVGKLKNLGRMPKRTTTGLVPEDTLAVPADVPAEIVQSAKQTLPGPFTPPSWYEIPRVHFTDALVYYLAEESTETAAWPVTYRALVSATSEHVPVLEHSLPPWVINLLLYNQIPMAQPPKITFVLEPWHGAQSGLPEMPAGHARLTANRLLRMHKAATFVIDKLRLDLDQTQYTQPRFSKTKSHTSVASHFSMSSTGESYDSRGHPNLPGLEMLCNDVVLPHTATLASVRQYCYKRSGDLLLNYRLIHH